MKSGIIFDIKQFAVFDGPGMRETIFLKGCPLHCPWCHNPEGQIADPMLMVSYAACIHCERCSAVCPSPDDCILCGRCIPECPLGLRRIAGEVITAQELEKRIRKDIDIYKENGGGITLSGGEPLMQHDFIIEFLDRIPDIHKVIETSGYASPEVYDAVYSRLDLIIQDIKIFDTHEHERIIGADNTMILRKAEKLKHGDKPFIIRIPLIPGITDTEKNYSQISSFLQGSRNLMRVELLPYVKAAGAKYQMVGRKYEPVFFNPEQDPVINTEIFEKRNIRCTVL